MHWWSPMVDGFLALLSTVVTTLIALYVPRILALLEKRTGMQLTDQQRTAVLNSAQTQAGIIETMLRQGTLQLGQITTTNERVLEHADAAIARVPNSAAHQGAGGAPLKREAMAAMIVGRVDTGPAVAPVVSH